MPRVEAVNRQRLLNGIKGLVMDLSLLFPPFRGRCFTAYPYMFNPRQLLLLSELASEAGQMNPEGVFVEAGCAYGATTVF